MVYFALCDICVGSLDAEYVGCIFLVCDADIYIFAQLTHHLSGFLLGPQLVSVVQVAGYGNARCFGSLARLEADRCNLVVQRRRDACEVEPFRSVKDFLPVEIILGCSCDRRARAVIDDLGRTLGSAFLQEIDADSVAAACDIGSVNAVFSQRIYSILSDLVCRELCDELRVKSIVCKGDSNVCLTAAVCGSEGISLHEAVISFRSKS